MEFTSADEAWDYYRANWIPEEFSDGFPDNPLEEFSQLRDLYERYRLEQAALVDYLNTIPEIKTVNQSELAATTLTGVDALVAYVSAGIIPDPAACFCFSLIQQYRLPLVFLSRKEEISIIRNISDDGFLL